MPKRPLTGIGPNFLPLGLRANEIIEGRNILIQNTEGNWKRYKPIWKTINRTLFEDRIITYP